MHSNTVELAHEFKFILQILNLANDQQFNVANMKWSDCCEQQKTDAVFQYQT